MGIEFLNPKKEKKVFLVLDIGTEAVKVLVAGKERKRYYYDRFSVWNSVDFEKDVVKKAISKVLPQPQRKEEILIILPPNILKAKISFPFFQRENPQSTTKKEEAKQIREKILNKVRNEVRNNFKVKTGVLPEELCFICQKILEIKMDGYRVPIIKGYQGKNLKFRVLSTFLNKRHLKNFEEIFKELNIKRYKIIHQSQKLISQLDLEHCIFLDVGGKITQIFLVKNGKIQNIEWFEMGGRDFTEVLQQRLGLSVNRARVLKERYSSGRLSEELQQRMESIFSDVLKDWKNKLKATLKTFKGLLPPTCYFSGGGSDLPEITQILTNKFVYAKKKNF